MKFCAMRILIKQGQIRISSVLDVSTSLASVAHWIKALTAWVFWKLSPLSL